jgi:serine/threonine protein phosphatase 1
VELIKKFKANEKGRDFVVGDIHGCFTMLREKLAEVDFDESKDRLFSVGDLVDRGFESELALEWLFKPFFHAVRGNHEQMAIDYMNGYSDPMLYGMNGGSWFMELPTSMQMEFMRVFDELPYAIEIETSDGLIGVIHAECPVADWNDLEAAFTGENAESFKQMAIWNRSRVTSGNDAPVENIDLVIVGHTPMQHPLQLGNVIYIDTGAVFGRQLTLAQVSFLQPGDLEPLTNEQNAVDPASAYESTERLEYTERDDA